MKNNFSYEGVGKHNQFKKNRLCGARISRQRLKASEYVQIYEQNDLHNDW